RRSAARRLRGRSRRARNRRRSDQLSGSWATAHLWRKVSGRPHSRGGGSTILVGSRAARSRSKIAGQTDRFHQCVERIYYPIATTTRCFFAPLHSSYLLLAALGD